MEKFTKDDVINFYKKYVKVDAPNRAKLAVYVLGKNLDDCKLYFVWNTFKNKIVLSQNLKLTHDFVNFFYKIYMLNFINFPYYLKR